MFNKISLLLKYLKELIKIEDQFIIFLLFTFIFIAISIYQFRIRKICIYSVKLTKPRVVLLIAVPLIFLGLAYYVGDKSWENYLLAISASLFIISGILGEGISKKGIYFRPTGATMMIIRLAKWEDIKDIKINDDKNKLESFRFKTETVFPDQYYNSEDILGIKNIYK